MIKQLIKLSLNHIPRPVCCNASRDGPYPWPDCSKYKAPGGVECPVLRREIRKFLPYGYVQPRPNALCPKCLSLERHRLRNGSLPGRAKPIS